MTDAVHPEVAAPAAREPAYEPPAIASRRAVAGLLAPKVSDLEVPSARFAK
ncbi:MAG: hypothetical protein ACKOA9_12395 [Actinomycetota bacterium]